MTGDLRRYRLWRRPFREESPAPVRTRAGDGEPNRGENEVTIRLGDPDGSETGSVAWGGKR